MTADALSTFESSLARLDVPTTRTSATDFEAVVEDLLDPPAIGVELPFEGVSLPESVNTAPTPADLRAAKTGVTAAAMGIASYGSVLIRATPDGAEPVSLFPDTHVAIVRECDVVEGMPEAFSRLGPLLRETRGSVVVATGPSATADMGALVRGAHGPKAVRVVILRDGGADNVADGSVDSGADGDRDGVADE
jgi:L-lactate dehydrogenase complex protein LldG